MFGQISYHKAGTLSLLLARICVGWVESKDSARVWFDAAVSPFGWHDTFRAACANFGGFDSFKGDFETLTIVLRLV